MSDTFRNEELRIRKAYAKRDASEKPLLYSWHNEDALFNAYRLRSTAASLLSKGGIKTLELLTVLDVGCGSGSWLRTLMDWGALPQNLHGIDLLEDRIEMAKTLNPGIDYRIGSGFLLPYENKVIELVSAHTVFSSILDGDARKALLDEMVRILSHNGILFIYDYRISDPRNKDTIGIRRSEIRRLFPKFSMQMRSLTLAPPVSRRIAPLSPLFAHFLEICFPFLRTHACYLLRRN